VLGALGQLKWAALFAIVVVGGIATFRAAAGSQPYTLVVPLADANGLYPGSDVLVAGSRAGSVEQISVHGVVAYATISVDPAEAPVHADATVQVRPKSLLGEKYIALDPGSSSGVLQSGTTLDAGRISESTDLQDVFNSLDTPTRAKLQTLIDNLGPAVAGRGTDLNQTFTSGTRDLGDLSQIANTLAQRDQDLQTVITSLNQVLTELSTSDRRAQLAVLIQNSNQLLANLAAQDATLKKALTETDAALARNDTALSGTGQNLNDIFRTLDPLVVNAGLLTNDLSQGMAVTVNNLGTCTEQTPLSSCTPGLLKGIREGPIVFGGLDAYGYATRISLVVGPGSGSIATPVGAAATPTAPGASSSGIDGMLQFLLGGGPS
jgi:phospholipid/cholesterol/gamma-HCH transport system substrate-binding protein